MDSKESNALTKVVGKVKVTKEDLINIAVAQHEEELVHRRDSLTKIIEKCERDSSTFYKKMRKSCEKTVAAIKEPQLKNAIEVLKLAGYTDLQYGYDVHWDLYGKRGRSFADVSPRIEEVNDDEENDEDDENLEICDRGGLSKPGIFYHIDIRGGDGCLRQYFEIPFNEEQLKIKEQWDHCIVAKQKAEKELKQVEKEIAEMGRLERKARAVVSLNVLKKSVEGQALLGSLRDLKTQRLSLDITS